MKDFRIPITGQGYTKDHSASIVLLLLVLFYIWLWKSGKLARLKEILAMEPVAAKIATETPPELSSGTGTLPPMPIAIPSVTIPQIEPGSIPTIYNPKTGKPF